jgi:uncharacterized protein (DUF697 family)
MTCQCSKCLRGASGEFEVLEFEDSPQGEFEFEDEAGSEEYEDEAEYESEGEHEEEAEFEDAESPFSEEEEAELAMELLSVASEDELDQFLGKLFKRVGRGLKKVGRRLKRVVRPLGRALRGVAKRALPFVGGALGSFIPIPGVGTAVGSALGGAVAKALEAELGELEQEEQEFEMARRFVRIAGTAATHAARADDATNPKDAARMAVQRAARKHLPMIGVAASGGGRWFRRGNRIVVVGA